MKTFYEFLMEMQAVDIQQNKELMIGADPEKTKELQYLLGKDYKTFVKDLGDSIKDDKFFNFLKAGLQDARSPSDDVVHFQRKHIPCKNLSPTQNEIDMDSSLGFPLERKSKEVILGYLKGGNFTIKKEPIVTCGGKYVVDGHHRWSELYCLNPEAQIDSIDFVGFKDPEKVLKITQLSIAATKRDIPVQTVDGINLIGVNQDVLFNFIESKMKMSENSTQAFFEFMQTQSPETILLAKKSLGIDESNELSPIDFAKYHVGKNVEIMNKNSHPASNAPERGYMPQTDSAGDWLRELESGKVNWKQEWKIMSGITIRD